MSAIVILIGGSSHCGKSTLAKALCKKLDAEYVPTDHLGRHPGRPWKAEPELIPPHVRAHYASLSVDELITDVLAYYQTHVPTIKFIIETHLAKADPNILIMEGSALWPAFVHTFVQEQVAAVWLTASNDLFRKRIYANSKYHDALPPEQQLIDAFLARTIRYNEEMMKDIDKFKLTSINIEDFEKAKDLEREVLNFLKFTP